MRLPHALSAGLALSLCSLSWAARSRAELLVVTSPGEPPALAHAEVAFALGEGEKVSWISLRVRRGPVAIVASLPESASGEPALDAWLTALERTASPNVLLPSGATDCGKGSSFAPVSWPRSPGVGAEELSLTTPEDVMAALSEHGLGEGLELPEAPHYLVWAWPVEGGDVTTRTLRISGESAPLSFVPASDWPVLVSGLSHGPVAWPGELGLDRLRVTFVAGKPTTDYLAQLDAWLQRERAPLLEARAAGTIFGWSILADTVSLPPLVRSYARAAADERVEVDVEGCTEQLQAFQNSEARDAAACGRATDAARALAAVGTGPVLQRWVLSGSAPIDVASLREGGDPRAPLLRASSIDASACPEVVVRPPIVLPPGSSGGSDPTGRGGSTAVIVEEEPVVVDSYRDESCSCAPGRDPHYHDHSHTTVYCSGDTSSSAGDDSCSSDSSSSSSDDSCSSDSSSSSSSDSCSGGSGSSYDGDTCTGRAAPDAETKASQASLTSGRRARPQRLRLSLWSLALAAAVLPIRRRKRAGVR